MKLKIVVSLPLLLASAALLLPATFAQPTTASGTYTLTHSMLTSAITAGPNMIVTQINTFALTGIFQGTAVENVRGLISSTGFVAEQGTATFTGTSNGLSGTTTFVIVGQGTSSSITGHFTIISGTGDLANIRGQGTFQGTGLTGTYTVTMLST